jgi:hypothetical protein
MKTEFEAFKKLLELRYKELLKSDEFIALQKALERQSPIWPIGQRSEDPRTSQIFVQRPKQVDPFEMR